MIKKLAILLVALASTVKAEVFTVTAYCACRKCCNNAYHGLTASGKYPSEGITCAAPRSLPFGTKLAIAGVGVRTVEDRLAQRYDGRIDVYFRSHYQAARFGKRRLTVSIYRHHRR